LYPDTFSGQPVTPLTRESICLPPGLYHSFWGESGFGDVLVGEVSSVNDDEHDNHFLHPVDRFNDILEDEPAQLVLCNEYGLFLS
jgi:D-lyxose ketol-isomerase